ncbi:MAG: ATP-binding protein, partial [Polyangiales bacterium]
DDGGTIRVEVERATITISNTGCTLRPADVERVFERFWRGDAARSGGTHAGLGLALSKKLVRSLGGTITARVDSGTFVAVVTL